MDPGFYRVMSDYIPAGKPQAEVPESEVARVRDNQARQSSAPDTNWTVFGPNIMRGNMEPSSNIDSNDPRMSVGWKANTSDTEMQNGAEPVSRPWMSTGEQQPFMWTSIYAGEDEATPKPIDHASKHPHPELSLPHPSLGLDFRMSVTLNPKISVGQTPFGHRNWISFTGGTWSGSWGSGVVLPGGQDSQIITSDGSARLETNYILQTYDEPPAYIVIKTHGWRTGPPDVLAKLADPALADNVDPHTYKMRLFIEMETGDERYRDKVNCGMWVGSGMRKGAEVTYDAYRLS